MCQACSMHTHQMELEFGVLVLRTEEIQRTQRKAKMRTICV